MVEIADIAPPATFTRLPDAVAALWEALHVLPLGWTQHETFRTYLGEGAVERITELLDRDGLLTLTITVAGRSHEARIRREQTGGCR